MIKNKTIPFLFIFIVTIIFLFAACPLDKWFYLGAGLLAISLMSILYMQVKKMEKLTNILDTKIINETKKGGV